MSLREKGKNVDLIPALRQLAEEDKLGRLTHRWLGWYDAIAVGDVVRHAEFLAAEEDYIPEENPAFGESIEKRKERIAHMNTIGHEGAKTPNGMTAQLMLLKDTPPTRPCSPCAGDSAQGNGGDSGGCAPKPRGTAAAAAERDYRKRSASGGRRGCSRRGFAYLRRWRKS